MLNLFKKKPKPPGPDFSAVDSPAKVAALFERGELEKMLLLPEDFGGEDIPLNTVYVPIGLADIKADTDRNVIAPLAAAGKVTRYVATPSYSGKSHIPIAIEIAATDPGQFSLTLKVWGKALQGEP